MLGISGFEFLVILIIAITVVPAKDWPDVVRWFGKAVRGIRKIIYDIEDGIENMENEIAKDFPIDKLSQKTMDDMLATYRTPIKTRRKKKKK